MKKQKFNFSQLEKFQIKDVMQKRIFGGACTYGSSWDKSTQTGDTTVDADAGPCSEQ